MKISRRIVYQLAGGHADLRGEDWSRIFSQSIGGINRMRPSGLADVSWNSCCWSLKTVKLANPFKVKKVRLIAGRNSPVFSSGISDPFKNIQDTGQAVLAVYNDRLSEARKECSDIRICVLVRNMKSLEFAFFERSIIPIAPEDYTWELNKNQNLEAFFSGVHAFTWQPHGSQFTIIESVPQNVTKFRILKHPDVARLDVVLRDVGFSNDWIEMIS